MRYSDWISFELWIDFKSLPHHLVQIRNPLSGRYPQSCWKLIDNVIQRLVAIFIILDRPNSSLTVRIVKDPIFQGVGIARLIGVGSQLVLLAFNVIVGTVRHCVLEIHLHFIFERNKKTPKNELQHFVKGFDQPRYQGIHFCWSG